MVPRVEEPGPVTRPQSSRGNTKTLQRSFSDCSEADDEESLFDPPTAVDAKAMELKSPRYPGEDVRPTSQKELAGWYSYGFAAEVFIICGIGSSPSVALLTQEKY